MAFGILAGMPGASLAASYDPVVPSPPESGVDFAYSPQNSGVSPTGKDITAEFTDQNFRAVVYERIGKAAPEPILDTDVAGVYDLYAYDRGIKNLDGLEYFITLGIFGVWDNQLTELPSLPASLGWFDVSRNQLTELPELPPNLESLYCFANQLTSLPGLPANLSGLYVWDNQLTELPALPASLRRLEVTFNQLTELPELPLSLELLNCYDNQLTSLPSLPPNLTYLGVANNRLTELPSLPENLAELDVGGNQLATLSKMPLTLTYLSCWGSGLTGILDVSYLHSLKTLACSGNLLIGLALSDRAPYTYVDVQYNFLPDKSAVTGRIINWDIDPNFIFSPQNSGVPPTGKDITAEFTDQNFRAAVYEHIGKTAPEPILDTDVAWVYDLYASEREIKNLDGLEHFTSLRTLSVYDNQLTELPKLPAYLNWLEVSNNRLTKLPELPPSLEFLSCGGNQLTSLQNLPINLILLSVSGNQLTELPALPASLFWLEAGYNLLTELPALPESLLEMGVGGNPLTKLPSLPPNLTYLQAANSQLTSLPSLPANLGGLYVWDNQLTELPALPTSLRWLNVGNNQLTKLPELPSNLIILDCYANQLTMLPSLPPSLSWLNVWDNQLTSLPVLPENLVELGVGGNQLATLPTMPPNLTFLSCWGNRLTGILDVSYLHSLATLICSDNRLAGMALSASAPYSYIYAAYNDMVSTSAVTGRTINWDIDPDFVFSPQNPRDDPVCSHEEWDEETITPATCTEKGVKKETCKRCGIFELLDIPPLGHAWDSGAVTTPATCAADGVMTFTCTRFTDCGATKTETIPKNPANHTGGTVERVITPATYTTEGLMGIYCGSCNSLLNTRVIPKLHDPTIVSDAEFLQARAAGILKNGLTNAQLHLSANNKATLTLIIDGRKIVLATNVNNRNVSGQIELPDGSGTLRFDIKGNGSNIKAFVVTKK